MSPPISMIAACSKNRVIGRDNQLPWNLPDDLKHFKQLTLNKTIVMGRKTFDSIGRALPQRRNVVLSSQTDLKLTDCEVFHDIEDILKIAQQEEVIIIGGAQIYHAFLAYAQCIYLTEIHETIDGDAYFPKLDPTLWQETQRQVHQADGRHSHAFDFVQLVRKG